MAKTMKPDMKDILKRLDLEATGHYDNGFYIIDLKNSDEYAVVYSKLCEFAQNQEYPEFDLNDNKNTIKAMHYFTLDEKNITYSVFLVANFQQQKYYVKIKQDDINLAVKDDL